MSPPSIARIAILLGVTFLMNYVIIVLVWTPSADVDPVLAWVVQPLETIVAFTGAAYVAWAIAVVIVTVRLSRSRPLPRVLWLGAAAFVAASVGALFVTVAASESNRDDLFGMALLVIAVQTIPFVIAAVLSTVLVELVAFRPRSVPSDETFTSAPTAGEKSSTARLSSSRVR
jgi:hypothetical protein